jgi:hypothetical protein
MRYLSTALRASLLLIVFARVVRTQQALPTFTAEDALNINSYTIADITADGRFVVATNTLRRDSYGQDFRRDGDPTYSRGVPVSVFIIDTRTGAKQAVFPEKRPLKELHLSPDGRRLSMLMYNGDVFEPVIYDRSTNKAVTSHLPAGKYVAENSDLEWTADGKQLVFSVHTMDWRKRARDTFTNMTTGPVFVQSSTEPFLAWDDIRRLGNVRSVVTFDPATGQLRELVPEARLGAYALADDGSAVVYTQDIQKKTDYDSFASELSLRTRSATGGAAGSERTLVASTKGAGAVVGRRQELRVLQGRSRLRWHARRRTGEAAARSSRSEAGRAAGHQQGGA